VSDLHHAELDARIGALRAGFWLGWLSVVAVGAGLALGLPARHRAALLALTGAAALAHAVVMAVPWRQWLDAYRGRVLLDIWSGGLIALVAVLVLVAGAEANLDLLLFLVMPFLATVHDGRRRVVWLLAAGGAFVLMMAAAPAPLHVGDVVMRGALLAAATTLAFLVTALIRREAAAHAQAAARAELEHTLLAETHHRVKNSLQMVSDVLLLNRPPGPAGQRFDETAERIKAIAAVHRLLAGGPEGGVDAKLVLTAVAAAAGVDVRLDADPFPLDAARAQHLGIAANELITNAAFHGRPPITVGLRYGEEVVLSVSDAGEGPGADPPRLGLQLVRQIVEHGLNGTFVLTRGERGGGHAEIRFPSGPACAS
jgi:two-component sensor histidine kinase